MLSAFLLRRSDPHLRKHGHEKKSSSSMMARPIRPWQLLDSSLPAIFRSSRKKTRVLPQPGIKPLSFATEITFNGSMLMICWRQTKSHTKCKDYAIVRANGLCSPRLGRTSFAGHIGLGSSLPHSGRIYRHLNGSCEKWARTFTCRPLRGSLAAN